MNNNPLRYADPSGHKVDDGDDGGPPRPEPHENKGCNDVGFSPEQCQGWLDKLTVAAVELDSLGLAISTIEVFLADGLYAALILTQQYELLPVAFQADMMIAGLAGPVENSAGLLSLGATSVADYLSGYTYVENSQLYVGQDTLVSLGTTAVGLIPEANIDYAASYSQMQYDTDRVFNNMPNSSVNVMPYLSLLSMSIRPSFSGFTGPYAP